MKTENTAIFAAASLFIMFCILPVPCLNAETQPAAMEEIVVTAAKIEESVDETTSSVTVIKGEEIKNMNVDFVPDVLRTVPELNIVQDGGAGKLATVFLRGGGSAHTLIMIDGVKVNNSTTGMFDFSGINTDDIERIEIIKGPQSTIYGSEAMSGVINIITKKGRGETKIGASLEAGSYGTYNPLFTISGGTGKVDYRLTGSYFNTDGISAAEHGTERDGYKNASVSGKFGYRPTDRIDIELSGRYINDRSELDAFGTDDPNYVQYGNHAIVSGKGKFRLTDTYEQVLSISTVRDSLRYRDPDTASNNSDITTAMDTIDWQHNLHVSESYTLTAGAEYRNEQGKNKGTFDQSVDNKAIYLNNKIKLFSDALVLNAGVRYDDHETFGSKTTYKVGALYTFSQLALNIKGSYGTGFRAPTLNELYYHDAWGSSGNLNLKPEKTSSWEIGVEKEIIKDRASVSVTYFDQIYDDLIQWVETPPSSWQWKPMNIEKAEIKGVETSVTAKITDYARISTGYAYLDTENKSNGMRLALRPRDKFTASVLVARKEFSLRADYIYVGGRFNDDANTKKLVPYALLNLSGEYSLNKNLSFFTRINNLFDKKYEEAAGYGTPGLSMFGGIRVTL